MKTVDIHTHLLSSEVSFNRFYDKIAIKFFGKKLGVDPQKLIDNPYEEYVNALMKNVKESTHLDKIVLFGVDARVDDSSKEVHKDPTVCATNEDLLKVYENNKDIVIPFFSINPKRADALDLIDKYVELGFKGAKFLQNYWGVDTRDKKYKPYFDKLASYGLPAIIHVGSESSVHSFKEYESIEMLNHPLECGVNTICAHMALSYKPTQLLKAFSKQPKNFNDEYFQIIKMLQKHPNLYADISALLTPVRAKVLRHLSQEEGIFDKMLFGTDFPVPYTTILNSYDLPYKKRFELAKVKNPFDRYSKAILEYFDKENPLYTNHEKILN